MQLSLEAGRGSQPLVPVPAVRSLSRDRVPWHAARYGLEKPATLPSLIATRAAEHPYAFPLTFEGIGLIPARIKHVLLQRHQE